MLGYSALFDFKIMKPIWSDMFYDIKECNDTEETATMRVSNEIKSEIRNVEDAIRNLEPKKALKILLKMRETY